MGEDYGALAPNFLDRTVIATTSRLPDNWFGLRLAIGLRRIVSMRLGTDGALDVERWGLRMRLHPRRNGCEKNLLFTPQMFEAPERAELAAEIDKARHVGRDFAFVDVGANVGLFSLFVASYAGPNARILAVEPMSEALRRLRFNVTANPDVSVRVIAAALGEAAVRVALEIDGRDLGGTRTRAWSPSDGTETPCAVRRPLLDVLRSEQMTYIDVLKIDVEGTEDGVLVPFFTDAPRTFWPALIIIEDARGSWRVDLFAFLAERGYAIAARTKLNVIMRQIAE
jgi:FkbM family methyltransferase